ncbi:MAG: NAD(P)H-hydrate epimerase [Candidatus Thorarchaeota archaeon]
MGLPGITTLQMEEVDRIMMEELQISVDLMMELAGNNLARLCVDLAPAGKGFFKVIAGPGNNGGGGIVAARHLKSWGHDVVIYLPRGIDTLRAIPTEQLRRARALNIRIFEGLPKPNKANPYLIIDSYLGYGYQQKEDSVSEEVFSFLRSESKIVSLDVPSGLDSTTGQSESLFSPYATMTIAFMKSGLLTVPQNLTGALFVADIGVPMSVYESRLNLSWKPPYSLFSLNSLYLAFSKNSLQRIIVTKKAENFTWSVAH